MVNEQKPKDMAAKAREIVQEAHKRFQQCEGFE